MAIIEAALVFGVAFVLLLSAGAVFQTQLVVTGNVRAANDLRPLLIGAASLGGVVAGAFWFWRAFHRRKPVESDREGPVSQE